LAEGTALAVFRLVSKGYCMASMAHRVVRRFLAAQQQTRDDAVPARNKDTGRIVYVRPSIMREEMDRFAPVSPNEAKPDEAKERQPQKPQRPQKPRRPHKPRVPFPIPEPYDKPPQPPKRIKRVKRVPLVKPVPLPKPSEPRHTPLIPGRSRYK